MNEINRENDILVSTILNPSAQVKDFLHNGITADNTQLLAPEEYKNFDFIKKQFTENGQFNNELFEQAYKLASLKYQDLSDIKAYEKMTKLNVWNLNDIYAPDGALKNTQPKADISIIRNPFESTTGVRSLFGTQDSNKSQRELALKNKIFDTETGKFLDKTAEDLGLLGGLFSKPLVYATWDEDGEHYDPFLHQTVKHKKGEWKLNDDGKFYTETIGKRQGYDKQFVALSDILTKEDSTLNKFDFFDSDDKEKSLGGTAMKTVASILPYFIPYVKGVWGGVTAAVALAQVLPTFGKALESIAVGDSETGFTREMHLLENYGKRFDASYSDSTQGQMFGIEQFGSLVSDIFGQLYQMRAMANMSKLFSNVNKTSIQEINKFQSKFGSEIKALLEAGKSKDEIVQLLLSRSPEVKAAIESQSKLARQLSMGYMGLLTSADVYKEALEGGYSRRTAGASALLSLLLQYETMMRIDDRVSGWFLDSVVGYHSSEELAQWRKMMSPVYKEVGEVVDSLTAGKITKEEAQGAIGKLLSKVKKPVASLRENFREGTATLLTRGTAEALEEVTEEAVMDATKGIVDFLTFLGLGGERNRRGSFNTIQNTFSQEGLARYAQNALGGFLGGSLFHLQENVVEPWLTGKRNDPNTTKEIIDAISQGHADELRQVVMELADSDNNLVASDTVYGDDILRLSKDSGQVTRGKVVAANVLKYIDYVLGILGDNHLDLTGDDLYRKVIRDALILPIIKESNLTELIREDFKSLAAELVKAQSDLDSLQAKEEPTADETKTISELKKTKKEVLDKVQKFLDGEMNEHYLKQALIVLNPEILNRVSNLSKFLYTRAKFGVDFSTLPDSGAGTTKESVNKAYDDFIKATDKSKLLNILSTAFLNSELMFSNKFLEYAKSKYKDARLAAFTTVLSNDTALTADENHIQDDNYYNTLKEVSQILSSQGKPGVSLEDIVMVDRERVFNEISKQIFNNNYQILKPMFDTLGTTVQNEINLFNADLVDNLDKFPIQIWSDAALKFIIGDVYGKFILNLVQRIAQANPDASVQMAQSLEMDPNGEITPESITEAIVKQMTNYEGNIAEDLSRSVVLDYIHGNDIIDFEVIKNIKKRALKFIEENKDFNPAQFINENIYYEDDYDMYELNISPSLNDDVLSVIKSGIESDKSQQEILDELFAADGVIMTALHADPNFDDLVELEVPNYNEQIKQYVLDFLNANKEFQLLQELQGKDIQHNPLIELLKSMDIELAEGHSQPIYDLLEQESTALQGLSNIDSYLKMPDFINRIDSALAVLNLAEAVLIGMEDWQIDGKSQLFGFNAQIKRYLNEFENGANADKYAVLESRDIHQINVELKLIKNKLDFLKALSGRNRDSAVKADQDTRIAHIKVITDQLVENAAKLKVDGVSILTDDDLSQLTSATDENRFIILGKIEHNMHERFTEAIRQNGSVDAVVEKLFGGLFTKDQLVKMGKESLSSFGLSRDTNSISTYDFLVYLTTVLALDQNEYYSVYQKYLEDPNMKLVPLYVQEYSTKIGYSFLKDSVVHDAVSKFVESKINGYPVHGSKIMFSDGVSGCGKTTAIAYALLKLANESNIYVAAPNKGTKANPGQAEKLNDSLLKSDETKVFDRESLLKLFYKDSYIDDIIKETNGLSTLNLVEYAKYSDPSQNLYYWRLKNVDDDSVLKDDIDTSKLPKVVVIDEITHFSTIDLQLLNRAAELYGFKLLVLGDSFQEELIINGKMPDGTSVSQTGNIEGIFAWKVPKIKISMRPGNSYKNYSVIRFNDVIETYHDTLNRTNDMNSALEKLTQTLQNIGVQIDYYQDADTLQGDKFTLTITSEDLNALKKAANGQTIGIIGDLDDEGKLTDNSAALKAAIAGSDLQEGDYRLYSLKKIHKNAVQGAEAEFFVIDASSANVGDLPTIEALQKIYTYITRSRQGSIIQIDPQVLLKLHIYNNKKLQKPDLWEHPGARDTESIKSTRIEEIKAILNGWQLPVQQQSEDLNPEQKEIPDDQLKDVTESLHEDQDNSSDVGTVNEDENISNGAVGAYTYGFYNHVGSIKNIGLPIASTVTESLGTNLDLDALLPAGTAITPEILRGFVKFKNLVTLYPNVASDGFRNGIIPAKFTEDIAMFLRAVFPDELSLSVARTPEAILNKIKSGELKIEIDQTPLLAGKRMSKEYDLAALKLGFNISKAQSQGKALILKVKHVKLSMGQKSKDVLLSTGVLSKSDTLQDAINRQRVAGNEEFADMVQEVCNEVVRLESDVESKCTGNSVVVYKLAKDWFPIDQRDCTFVAKKSDEPPFFDSLKLLLEMGANIKQVGFINDVPDVSGKPAVLKFLSKYCPNIEDNTSIYDKSTNKLKIRGRYFAIISYTNAGGLTSDVLVLLSPRQHLMDEAIKFIIEHKGSKVAFTEKLKQINEFSQTQLVLDTLTRIGAFDIAVASPEQSKYAFNIFKKMLNAMSQNPQMHGSRYDKVKELVDKHTTDQNISKSEVEQVMKETQGLGIIFADLVFTLSPDNDVYVLSEFGGKSLKSLSLKPAFYNVRVAFSDKKLGYNGLLDLDLDKLGTSTHHIETKRFGLDASALRSAQLVSIEQIIKNPIQQNGNQDNLSEPEKALQNLILQTNLPLEINGDKVMLNGSPLFPVSDLLNASRLQVNRCGSGIQNMIPLQIDLSGTSKRAAWEFITARNTVVVSDDMKVIPENLAVYISNLDWVLSWGGDDRVTVGNKSLDIVYVQQVLEKLRGANSKLLYQSVTDPVHDDIYEINPSGQIINIYSPDEIIALAKQFDEEFDDGPEPLPISDQDWIRLFGLDNDTQDEPEEQEENSDEDKQVISKLLVRIARVLPNQMDSDVKSRFDALVNYGRLNDDKTGLIYTVNSDLTIPESDLQGVQFTDEYRDLMLICTI